MKVLKIERGLTAEQRGEMHGETFRREIKELAQIRTDLIMWAWDHSNPSEVLERAKQHLRPLQEYDQDLYSEFHGIARAAGITEESLLVLNHYTDLRDLGMAQHALEEGCSILHARHGEEVLLAQTWDMHATAEPHVLMLYLPDEEVWTLTITGCLALCGLNRAGVAVAINNLVMSDAVVGISWPTLVRKMLRQPSVEEAEGVLNHTLVGSGHHYALVSPNRSAAWESSGTIELKVYDGDYSPYVHTNHCLNQRLDQLSRISPTSTTHDRYRQATDLLKENPAPSAQELWDMMGCTINFPHSLFTDRSSNENPHGVATCARVIMDCRRRKIWARAAKDPDQTPLVFEFEEALRS